MSPAPAIFLDRDGVLNAVVWREGKPASPRTAEELVIEPGALAALTRLKALGYRLLVVTNQPDVARGRMTLEALDQIHQRLAAALPLDAISACMHDDADGCACRKPKPGLILGLAERCGIDLARSWMIGDQDRDIACARAAGCRSILLGRDYNTRAGADRVVDTLAEAALVIAPRTATHVQ